MVQRNSGWRAVAAVLGSLAGSIHAQDPLPPRTEQVTVTAERFPVLERESPRFVTVLAAEDLKDLGALNLVDALRRVGGLAYKAFGPLGISNGGMNSTVSIRGIGNGELVLINGAPIQGAAGGAYDLNTIPLDQIERVEILRGAASALYGADAMSGVINIIMRPGADVRSTKASALLGSEGLQNYAARFSLPGFDAGLTYQRLGALEEVSRNYSGKYRFDTGDSDLAGWNLAAAIGKNLRLEYLGAYSSTSFLKVYDAAKPTEGTDQSQVKHNISVRYETKSWQAKVFGMMDVMRRNEFTKTNPPLNRKENFDIGGDASFRSGLFGWGVNGGVSWVHRGADYSDQFGRKYRDDYALFAEGKKTFAGGLTASLGARWQFIDGEPGTKDYSEFVPSAGLTWTASARLNLFANAGRAFRAPTFNNLYYRSTFLVGNPNLGPESGWTYEAGGKWESEAFRLRLAGFHMDYDDKIEIDRRVYPQTYFNAGDYRSTGLEWELRVDPFPGQTNWLRGISLSTSGYWAEPTARDASGAVYQTGPKLSGGAGVAFYSPSFILDLNGQVLVARERNLENSFVMNMTAKQKLWTGFVVFGIDDILDERPQVSGELTPGATTRYEYREPGRIVKLGYEITLQ